MQRTFGRPPPFPGDDEHVQQLGGKMFQRVHHQLSDEGARFRLSKACGLDCMSARCNVLVEPWAPHAYHGIGFVPAISRDYCQLSTVSLELHFAWLGRASRARKSNALLVACAA